MVAVRRLAPIDDVELLELVAGGAARDLGPALSRIGGLAALSAGEPRDAGPLLGLSGAPARRLGWAIELSRRLAACQAEPGWRVRAPTDVGERLRPAMGALEQEELRVLLLNTKNVVTGMVTVYLGNLAGSSVRVGEVFRDAVRRQAAAIVVVHNHPSGDPTGVCDEVGEEIQLA